jgi:competence protein ComEA
VPTVPQPTKPQLALYAALAIAVLLIGARFLRTGDGGSAGGGDPGGAGAALADGGGGLGVPDGGLAADGGGLGVGGAYGEGAGGGANGAGADGGANGAGAGGGADGASAGGFVVDVKGAVRRPGVYRVEPGARVLDAVERAGGLSGRADRRGVNLAARVVDGGEVIVPRRGERVASGGAAGTTAAGGTAAAGGTTAPGGAATPGVPLQLDLNTATAQELEVLDGVGPATAAKIVAFREQNGGIGSIDELDEVSGIGEAKLAAIRAQLGR